MPHLENFWRLEWGYGIEVQSNDFNVLHERSQFKGMKSTAVLKFPQS
jgi:hypothetical protein